ncbi:MAG TPA: GntR family transcriptional regulator [Verrucomicrobiae bacterium]|nr:GntR family transcriptional regulator [Verrucomicrobiae bacterium]
MSNHKYRQIFEKLQDDICSGHYKPGSRLPSESELVRRFEVSRMTVFHAMRELQTLGLIVRRVGSGTFVSSNAHSGSHIFGLLIPELGQTEIFEAICQGMMEAQEAMHHSLLWGNSVSREQDTEKAAEQLCEHYISRKVSGVFFAPVEYSTNRFQSNHRIVAALDRAGIPVVLLDRCLEPYPRRSKYDLVGIDNRRAGYVATEHLIRADARRIVFFARPNSAPTVDARIAGYREALQSHGGDSGRDLVRIGEASDAKFVKSILKKDRPHAFVCANDLTAGDLMHTLISLGERIPKDIRIVGIDDVKYARLLPVPLTTLHQPCRDLGRMALTVMLDRIANPDLPPRDVLLRCELIVRKSCGMLSKMDQRQARSL